MNREIPIYCDSGFIHKDNLKPHPPEEAQRFIKYNLIGIVGKACYKPCCEDCFEQYTKGSVYEIKEITRTEYIFRKILSE